ncbi:MAG: hypothetical protein ACW98Y_00890 [Candidatus Thorarchaeota archaeon]|jgi:hypothetical protein
MQLTPDFLQQIMFVTLNALGIIALMIILGYAVYGTETDEE